MIHFILHRIYLIIVLIIISLLITWIALYSLKKKLDFLYENYKKYSFVFKTETEKNGELEQIEYVKPKIIKPYNEETTIF